MTDNASDIVVALKPEELRETALHLAAAIHHLQTSIPETVKAIQVAQSGRPPNFGPIQNSLQMSREELARALDILDRDPRDGHG